MLFIDNRQAEVLERDCVLNDGVRANASVDLASGQCDLQLPFLSAAQ